MPKIDGLIPLTLAVGYDGRVTGVYSTHWDYGCFVVYRRGFLGRLRAQRCRLHYDERDEATRAWKAEIDPNARPDPFETRYYLLRLDGCVTEHRQSHARGSRTAWTIEVRHVVDYARLPDP